MYIIEANDPYSRRKEYFSGLDQVTRKSLWTRDQAEAVQFATRPSAERLAGEPLLGRAAAVSEIVDTESIQLRALEKAEAFMAGFEGDEAQETLEQDLAEVRAAIAAAKSVG